MIHECTSAFSTELFATFLEMYDVYNMDELVSPHLFGWPCFRPRPNFATCRRLFSASACLGMGSEFQVSKVGNWKYDFEYGPLGSRLQGFVVVPSLV